MFFLSVFVISSQAIAQEVSVTGKVTSAEDGFPLPGVSVKIKGTNTVSQTNQNGVYAIKASATSVLVFNYIGSMPEERTVGSLTVINVQLKNDSKVLNEVVVTAFGVKQEVRGLGFSTQSVKAKEIVDSKQPNLVNALQDGIPVDNTTPVGQGGLGAGTAPASNRAIDINPEDIESITVLKGPAAAALYGIRAASGAIVVTTKKGSGGSARINYQNTFSFDNVNRVPTLQDKFKQGEQGVFNAAASDSWGPEFTPGETIYDNLGNFFETAFAQNHDISVSGSSDQTRYFTSASLLDQGSIVDNSDFKRKSFRLNADTKMGDKLTIGGSANYVRTDRTYVPQGSPSGVMGALYWPRNDDMKNYLNPNGTQRIFNVTDNDNPYWSIENKPIINSINRVIAIGNIDYNPFSFLNVSYRLAKKTIAKDFKFSLALGQNLESATSGSTTSTAIRFIDPTFPSINNTVATDRTVSERLTRRRIFGLFGDFTADWKGMAYVNLRARNDWSSTLPVSDNSFFYPSVSGAIILTDVLRELGLKPGDDTFSYGKIRAAFSEVGKDAPAHVTTSSLASVTNTFTINPRGFITNANNPFGNPTLVPEFTRAFELGTDLRFLKNRIGIDFTYYNSTSTNQILATRVPPSAGAFLTYLNGGSIKNEGVEFVFNAQAITNPNFKWSVDVNFAKNTSIVKALPGLLDRVELSDAWVASNAAQGAAFLNGSLFGINGNVWKRNASGQLLLANNGYPQVQTALTNIGDRNPDFTMGITNTFSHKNLSFAFMVDVRVGGKVYNATENSLVRSGLSTKTLDRGTKVFEGIIESTGAVNTIAVPLNQNYYQTIYANQGYDFVEDGGWYRLRYAALSYKMPNKLLEKIDVKGLSFTVTGRNLLLITDYSGVDPEVSGSGAGVGGSGSFGFDNLGIPATRDVNKDPNNPTKISAASRLIGAITTSNGSAMWRGSREVAGLTQYGTTKLITGANASAEQWRFTSSYFLWQNAYVFTMPNCVDLIVLGEEEGSPHFVGAGKTLLAINYGLLTDQYGSIVVDDFYDGKSQLNLTPLMQDQETVYKRIDQLLDEAIAAFNSTSNKTALNASGGDILFQGDVNKWKRFAWALKARYLNHLSKKSALYKPEKIIEATSNAFNADGMDAEFPYLSGGIETDQNPWFSWGGFVLAAGVTDPNSTAFNPRYFAWSQFFVNMLTSLPVTNATYQDPRISRIMKPAASDGQYRGLQAGGGLVGGQEFLQMVNQVMPLKRMVMIMVDLVTVVKLIEAEAKLRSKDVNGAILAYTEGVKANMRKLGVTAPEINAYIAALEANGLATHFTNLTNGLSHIMRQKYISLCLNPETWVDMRRVDFSQDIYGPSLVRPLNLNTVVFDANNPNQWIRAMVYEGNEQTRNPAAVGDNSEKFRLLTPLWWDKAQ
ncbi:hypothetical protein GHT06_003667 [Daphnia sinensis]|uniref:Uncharacterized protein n=1 Tax=Daphnia sinensis TaxID=1820382 RepID=A0AAD5KVR2_9CRUS|nr:hypothetical protein GHT06_003667 [Daphnia sinensis]